MDYIEIFFDTCILRTKNNYSEFSLGLQYTSFVDFLGTHDLIDKCRLNFSRIVLKELSKQITESYEKDLEILKRFKSINEKTIEIEHNYIENIDKEIEDYIKNEKGNIIEIPTSTESYKKIIDRAINKRKPFCGDKGDSDKGFKDAIQWESILKYAKNCKSEKYILLTENKNDFTNELEKEFKDKTKKQLKIFKNIGEAQKYILELNDEKALSDNLEKRYDKEGKLSPKGNLEKLFMHYFENGVIKYTNKEKDKAIEDLKIAKYIVEYAIFQRVILGNKDKTIDFEKLITKDFDKETSHEDENVIFVTFIGGKIKQLKDIGIINYNSSFSNENLNDYNDPKFENIKIYDNMINFYPRIIQFIDEIKKEKN